MLAPAPLLGTDKALKTASFAAHRPAKEASESGALEQYSISAGVKFRSRNVCDVGTLEINSVSTLDAEDKRSDEMPGMIDRELTQHHVRLVLD